MKTYKYTLFISLVVSSLILISRLSFDINSVVTVLSAGIISTLFPYFDYLVSAFYLSPNAESSITIKSFFLRREYVRLIKFIDSSNLSELKPTINSAHFQAILMILGFYFLTTHPLLFGFSLLLNLMVNLTYRLYAKLPYYLNWFWLLKNPVSLSWVKIWIYLNIVVSVVYIILI